MELCWGMARQRRFQYPGAVYHIMARGDGGKTVFETEKITRDRNYQNILALVIYSAKSRHGSARRMTLTEIQTDEVGICT